MEKKKLTDIENEFLTIVPSTFVRYIPEYRKYTKSVTGAILLRAIIDWYKSKGSHFYKFKEPCNHSLYVEGDSWCEELGFGRREFDTAIKDIGQKLKKDTKKNYDVFVWYWIDMDRLTHYQVNIKAVAKMLLDLYPNTISKSVVEKYIVSELYVKCEPAVTESANQPLHVTIDNKQRIASTPPFPKKENSNTQQPNTNTLKDTHSILNTHEGATLNNKVKDPKESVIKTESNNTVKPTETASEQTNASKPICLYTSVAKMALNSYNEIAKRKYTFKRHGAVIVKRLKAEFSKDEIKDPNTFELIKTMLEVKFSDTTPDSKGFALLPIRNYEPITLFSPSKFATYLQAAENTLIQKQNRKQKAAENKNINPFLGII